MSTRKEMKQIIKACKDAGLTYDSSGKHDRITNPETGKFVTLSRSPSDVNAYRQAIRDIRKYLGVEIDA